MIEFLLAEIAPAVQPSTVQTYGPVTTLLLALGGWKGLAWGILWLQGRNGNTKRLIDERACDRRHASEERVRTKEIDTMVKSMDKLEAAVTRLHERFDQIIKGK
jgi:hypothetical protein